MATRDSIETAYCFLHQKWRVYRHSTISSQRDDIEYAVARYAEEMDPALYRQLARGRNDYLLSHDTFADDIRAAVENLEKMSAANSD